MRKRPKREIESRRITAALIGAYVAPESRSNRLIGYFGFLSRPGGATLTLVSCRAPSGIC